MDGLIHTAVEAEEILNRAKHVNVGLTHFERGVVDHKMTWNHDKMLVSDMVEDSRTKFRRNSSSSSTNKASGKFDLFKKLHELYEDLCKEDSQNANYQSLRTTSHLLEKLLTSYNLNTLIINLYPGNKGYSLSLKVNGNTQQLSPDGTVSDDNLIETPRWPYEEEELLSYIDNEELPVVLLDLLESEHSCLFYSGCIIAQIRDYRQAYPSFVCDTHHVLLRPTTQSILTDAMSISSKFGWTGDDRTAFESALVLATAPPLCLDPSPSVGLLATRLHSAPRLFNTPRIRRQAKKFSQVAVNRKRKLDQFTHYHGLELVDLIHRHRAKNTKQSTPQSRLSSKFPKRPPETFRPVEPLKIDNPPLTAPIESVTPIKIARVYDRPRISQDCSPQLIEEYILETEKHSAHGGSGFFHIKLTILQRPSDQEFLGELYVDRDHVDGEKNGAACRFVLGNRIHANKYIQQFTEIFTEEGRKHVRITHLIPGQVPRVSFTAGLKDLNQTALLQRSSNSTVFTLNPAAHSNLVLPTTSMSAAKAVKVVTSLKSVMNTASISSDTHVKPSQPSPKAVTTTRTTPQVHDIHSSQPTNQLLTQQLANPPQPLNPQKMQSAIIHIQHPLMSTAGAAQVQGVQYTTATTIAQQKATVATKPRTTNAAINALVTSLMNSAQQFQQAKAAVSTPSSNSTILNLLNSAPAAMTHPPSNPVESTTPALESPAQQKPLIGRTVSIAGRIITNVTTTTTSTPYTHQVMNYKTESDNTRVTYSDGGLLERLIAANSIDTTDTGPETQPSLPTAQPLQLQGVSLASLQGLQGIQGVQNVQVQIPGMAQPISLQLNVSAPSGLLVSMPPTTSVVLNNQSSVLSLPIAQLMSSGVKNQVRGGMQIMRGRSPVPRPARATHTVAINPVNSPGSAALPNASGSAQFISQAATVSQHSIRRKSNPADH